MVNSPLIRLYFWGGWHWRVPVNSHDKRVNFIFVRPLSFLAVKAVVIFGDLFFEKWQGYGGVRSESKG